MTTVILCVGEHVMVGWNESVQPEEDPSYASWEYFPSNYPEEVSVTHWMPLPQHPFSKGKE